MAEDQSALKPHTLEEVDEWELRSDELEEHLRWVELHGAEMEWNGEDPVVASQRYVQNGRTAIAATRARIAELRRTKRQ
jgi:3-dehydroquinate dehydratase